MLIRKRNSTSVATNFAKALREVVKKDPEATVKINRTKPSGVKARYLDEVSGRELQESDNSVEELLKAGYGGGDYALTFSTSEGLPPHGFDKTYRFYIDGPSKGAYKESDSEGRRRRDDTAMTTLTDVMGKLADAAIGKSRDDDILREVLAVALNAAFSGNDALDQAQKLVQISQSLQPQLQQEDPMTVVLGAFAPVFAQLLASRAGEQIATTGMSANSQPILPPGASQQGARQSLGQTTNPMAQADSTREKDDQKAEDRHYAFQKLMVVPFRQHISAGIPVQQLAGEMLYMIRFSEYWMADDPPALVKGFIGETDPNKLLQAYNSFCSAIPELKNQVELQEQIKAILIQVLIAQIQQSSQVFAGEESSAEDDNMQGDDSGEAR